MPAYAYLRKSSVSDPTRELSHEVQENAVRELAARNGDGDGLTILSDWDKSGRLGADKRPGYRALLDAIEGGRATAIYSYSLSRFGRSLAELARLIADCDRRNVPVRLYADHVDTSTASGKLLANVLGSVAQFEADVASERIRATQAVKRANGERLGAREYGDGEDDDAQAVRDAFAKAGSYSGAARLLNERGIKPRNSRRGWWPSSVNVVMQRLEPRPVRLSTKGSPAGGTDLILAQLLRCPTCGTRLTGQRDRTWRKGGPRIRYACRLGSVRPHERVSISEHLILPAIRAEVARLATPDSVEAVTHDAEARASLVERKARVLDLFEAGHIDREDRERRLQKVYADLAALDARLTVLEVPEIDWAWPPRELNAVLRALFDRIDLDPSSFQPVAFVWLVPEWRAA